MAITPAQGRDGDDDGPKTTRPRHAPRPLRRERVKVYVTNMASGTVSVIDARKMKVVDTIKVGAEPFGCALTPDGRRLYVAQPVLGHRVGHRHASGQSRPDHHEVGTQAAWHRDHSRWKEGLRDPVALQRRARRTTASADADRGRGQRPCRARDRHRRRQNQVVKTVILNPLAERRRCIQVGRRHAGARAAGRRRSTTCPGHSPICWRPLSCRARSRTSPAPAHRRTARSAST